MSRFAELLQAANNLKLLAAIGRTGGALNSVADLVDNMIDSPQMLDSIRRFRAVAGAAAMLEQRYPPLQPDIDRLIKLPEGSLGRSYAELIRRLNYDPEFFRPRPIDSEAQWLTQRVATTHDIHHLVAGFGTSPVGESGVLAITAAQIGFPAYVLLTTAGQLASFRFQLDRYEELAQSVAHGMTIAHQAHCLVAARWEEGWERSISDWRLELGISDPADAESYGLGI
jgi:ubiquinone biosynthesis protein COQ4